MGLELRREFVIRANRAARFGLTKRLKAMHSAGETGICHWNCSKPENACQ